jgi:cation/acetate symporter
MPTTSIGTRHPVAIAFFLAFVLITLGITYWAARQSKTSAQFYAAGRSISGFQNGLALAGDFMSAASFLGIAGLVATGGYNGLIYSIGYLVGWPIVMFLIAEPLRNLGKYTFADVVAARLKPGPVRTVAAITTVVTVVIYLVAQMVGAGNLIKLMFNLPYEWALYGVGALMIAYVLFGGMLATTWVQIIKAVLLLGGATLLVALVMNRFGWSYNNLFAAVEAQTIAEGKSGATLLQPHLTKAVATTQWDTLSLAVGLMFGTAGLPHILMRFYTVPDAREARKSVFVATGFIGYFYILTFTIGYAAAALVAPKYLLALKEGGFTNNAAAPILAEILGGPPFLGFLSAVAFATILAVVAGLTLAGASALSHDLYVGVIRKGGANEANDAAEVHVAKAATIGLGVLAVLLGLAFQNVNVAFMVGLAFSVAASANFPALVLSIMWRPLSTAGAVAGMVTGLVASVVLIVLSPTVWVDVFQAGVAKEAISAAPFGWKNPTLISMPLAFAVAMIVSLLKPEPQAQADFDALQLRALTGRGAE